MHKNKQTKHLKRIFFLLIIFLLSACRGINPQAPIVGERANIVFILTDDQEYDTIRYMPNVNRLLAEKGLSMQNFFVNVPQCCPSRSTILLGQYSHNTKILRNGGDNGGFRTFFRTGREENTFAVGLQVAGYRTALMGKYLNGYPAAAKKRTYVPPGWDEWYVPVAGNPYNQFGYKLNMNGAITIFHDDEEDYLTDVLSHLAVDFIKRSAPETQPFFLYVSTYAPHGPSTPAPRHIGMFADISAPRYESFNEADVSDKPAYIRDLNLLSPQYVAGVNNRYVARLQTLQAVDELVEEVIYALEQTGELDNTYILFSSDNGFHLGQHRQEAGKLSPYEEDIRVPMIVRGPGIPVGVLRTEIAGNVDLAATFAEMGGFTLLEPSDGHSLLPIFNNQPLASHEWRQAYLIEYWAGQLGADGNENPLVDGTLEPPDATTQPGSEDALPNIPAFKGLRTAKYTYFEYATGEIELYDLEQDPYQIENLAQKANPVLLKYLSNWLGLLSACSGDTCRQTDSLAAYLAIP